jgi:hypothetical protein
MAGGMMRGAAYLGTDAGSRGTDGAGGTARAGDVRVRYDHGTAITAPTAAAA